MRHWTDTPCTCGLAKSKIKGAHHDMLCERAIARNEQRRALMAKTEKPGRARSKREAKR